MTNVYYVFEGLRGGYLPNTVNVCYGIRELRYELEFQRLEHYTDFETGQKQYEILNTVNEIVADKTIDSEIIYITDHYNKVSVKFIGKFSKKQIEKMREEEHE